MSSGPNHSCWKGGRRIANGYVQIWNPNHPKSSKDNYVFEHILMAEIVLGDHLPKGAEVHHIDGNPANNKPGNLVICQDRSYHMLLHTRQRAFDRCGHANWIKCWICREYGDPQDMHSGKNGKDKYHLSCRAQYKRELRKGVKRDKLNTTSAVEIFNLMTLLEEVESEE